MKPSIFVGMFRRQSPRREQNNENPDPNTQTLRQGLRIIFRSIKIKHYLEMFGFDTDLEHMCAIIDRFNFLESFVPIYLSTDPSILYGELYKASLADIIKSIRISPPTEKCDCDLDEQHPEMQRNMRPTCSSAFMETDNQRTDRGKHSKSSKKHKSERLKKLKNKLRKLAKKRNKPRRKHNRMNIKHFVKKTYKRILSKPRKREIELPMAKAIKLLSKGIVSKFDSPTTDMDSNVAKCIDRKRSRQQNLKVYEKDKSNSQTTSKPSKSKMRKSKMHMEDMIIPEEETLKPEVDIINLTSHNPSTSRKSKKRKLKTYMEDISIPKQKPLESKVDLMDSTSQIIPTSRKSKIRKLKRYMEDMNISEEEIIPPEVDLADFNSQTTSVARKSKVRKSKMFLEDLSIPEEEFLKSKVDLIDITSEISSIPRKSKMRKSKIYVEDKDITGKKMLQPYVKLVDFTSRERSNLSYKESTKNFLSLPLNSNKTISKIQKKEKKVESISIKTTKNYSSNSLDHKNLRNPEKMVKPLQFSNTIGDSNMFNIDNTTENSDLGKMVEKYFETYFSELNTNAPLSLLTIENSLVSEQSEKDDINSLNDSVDLILQAAAIKEERDKQIKPKQCEEVLNNNLVSNTVKKRRSEQMEIYSNKHKRFDFPVDSNSCPNSYYSMEKKTLKKKRKTSKPKKKERSSIENIQDKNTTEVFTKEVIESSVKVSEASAELLKCMDDIVETAEDLPNCTKPNLKQKQIKESDNNTTEDNLKFILATLEKDPLYSLKINYVDLPSQISDLEEDTKFDEEAKNVCRGDDTISNSDEFIFATLVKDPLLSLQINYPDSPIQISELEEDKKFDEEAKIVYQGSDKINNKEESISTAEPTIQNSQDELSKITILSDVLLNVNVFEKIKKIISDSQEHLDFNEKVSENSLNNLQKCAEKEKQLDVPLTIADEKESLILLCENNNADFPEEFPNSESKVLANINHIDPKICDKTEAFNEAKIHSTTVAFTEEEENNNGSNQLQCDTASTEKISSIICTESCIEDRSPKSKNISPLPPDQNFDGAIVKEKCKETCQQIDKYLNELIDEQPNEKRTADISTDVETNKQLEGKVDKECIFNYIQPKSKDEGLLAKIGETEDNINEIDGILPHHSENLPKLPSLATKKETSVMAQSFNDGPDDNISPSEISKNKFVTQDNIETCMNSNGETQIFDASDNSVEKVPHTVKKLKDLVISLINDKIMCQNDDFSDLNKSSIKYNNLELENSETGHNNLFEKLDNEGNKKKQEEIAVNLPSDLENCKLSPDDASQEIKNQAWIKINRPDEDPQSNILKDKNSDVSVNNLNEKPNIQLSEPDEHFDSENLDGKLNPNNTSQYNKSPIATELYSTDHEKVQLSYQESPLNLIVNNTGGKMNASSSQGQFKPAMTVIKECLQSMPKADILNYKHKLKSHKNVCQTDKREIQTNVDALKCNQYTCGSKNVTEGLKNINSSTNMTHTASLHIQTIAKPNPNTSSKTLAPTLAEPSQKYNSNLIYSSPSTSKLNYANYANLPEYELRQKSTISAKRDSLAEEIKKISDANKKVLLKNATLKSMEMAGKGVFYKKRHLFEIYKKKDNMPKRMKPNDQIFNKVQNTDEQKKYSDSDSNSSESVIDVSPIQKNTECKQYELKTSIAKVYNLKRPLPESLNVSIRKGIAEQDNNIEMNTFQLSTECSLTENIKQQEQFCPLMQEKSLTSQLINNVNALEASFKNKSTNLVNVKTRNNYIEKRKADDNSTINLRPRQSLDQAKTVQTINMDVYKDFREQNKIPTNSQTSFHPKSFPNIDYRNNCLHTSRTNEIPGCSNRELQPVNECAPVSSLDWHQQRASILERTFGRDPRNRTKSFQDEKMSQNRNHQANNRSETIVANCAELRYPFSEQRAVEREVHQSFSLNQSSANNQSNQSLTRHFNLPIENIPSSRQPYSSNTTSNNESTFLINLTKASITKDYPQAISINQLSMSVASTITNPPVYYNSRNQPYEEVFPTRNSVNSTVQTQVTMQNIVPSQNSVNQYYTSPNLHDRNMNFPRMPFMPTNISNLTRFPPPNVHRSEYYNQPNFDYNRSFHTQQTASSQLSNSRVATMQNTPNFYSQHSIPAYGLQNNFRFPPPPATPQPQPRVNTYTIISPTLPRLRAPTTPVPHLNLYTSNFQDNSFFNCNNENSSL